MKEIIRYQSKVDQWMEMWNVEKTDRRKLFKSLTEIFSNTDGHESFKLRFLILFFDTFLGESSLPPDVTSMATDAVVAAIKSPLAAFAERIRLLEVRQSVSQSLFHSLNHLLNIFNVYYM